jgi:CelD/BcsL family acetyltransferase involved in cellulose biosynthesis
MSRGTIVAPFSGIEISAVTASDEQLRVQLVDSEEEFRRLEKDWNTLDSASDTPNIFSSFDWAWGWWSHIGRNESILGAKSLFIVVIRSSGGVVGIAPLMIREPSRKGFTVRKLEFIGSTFNDYNDILLCWDKAPVIRALAELLAVERGRWDLIDLRSFPGSSATPGLLANALAELRLQQRVLADDPCPFLSLTTDWEGMLRGFSRNTRLTFRNQANRLKRLGAQGFSVRIIENPQDEPGLLHRMAQVEGRKQIQGVSGNRFVAAVEGFIEFLFKTFGPAGRLYVAVMEQGSRLIAYQLGFRVQANLWDYTTAYDPAFAKLSPGTMLIPPLVDYGFHNHYREFNFLRGDEPYKRKLAKSAHATRRVEAWKREGASCWKAFVYFKVRAILYRQRWAARFGFPYAPRGEV